MKYKWIIKGKIAVAESDIESLLSDESKVDNNDFAMVVTIKNYDFRLIWRFNDSIKIRHYMYTISEYPKPSSWELFEFNQFLDYETRHGRKVLLWFESNEILKVFTNSIKRSFLNGETNIVERPYKLQHCKGCREEGCLTDIFCHTSSIEHGKSILSFGKLLSSKNARGVSTDELVIEERNAAGDPHDYFDYVMLSYGNCIAGDRLVAERRLGRFPKESDLSDNFYPGIRYYFRRKDIESNPNYCCDGYHHGKVKEFIDLDKYMICCVIPKAEEDNFRGLIPKNLIDKVRFIDHSKMKDIFEWTSTAYEIAKESLL